MTTTVPEIAVSEKTQAWIRHHQLLRLSQRFVGMDFTYDGTWHGNRGGHAHTEPSMGKLWVTVMTCPECLMAEWPGWSITHGEEGYAGTDGERAVYGRSRSQFVCRLSVVTGRPW